MLSKSRLQKRMIRCGKVFAWVRGSSEYYSDFFLKEEKIAYSCNHISIFDVLQLWTKAYNSICPKHFRKSPLWTGIYMVFRRNAEKFVVELEKIVDAPKSKTFVCANAECRKVLKKAFMITRLSKTSTQTYLACPYCLSKVETTFEAECPYYLGFLNFLSKIKIRSKDTSIPDQCLMCPKIIQCKKEILP